jgi:sterol desaturase/sphingolipid hydroxylase (fatty acid hydroxylase superfamily)
MSRVIDAQDYKRDLRLEQEMRERGIKVEASSPSVLRDEWRRHKHKHAFPIWRHPCVSDAYLDLLGVVLWQDVLIGPCTVLLHAPLASALAVPWGWDAAAIDGFVGSGLLSDAGWMRVAVSCALPVLELAARALMIVLLDEAWIYAGHRFIHLPGVYEAVHQFHHHTTQSAISANATHPVEGALIGAPILLSMCHIMDMPLAVRVLAACFGYALNVRLHAGWLEDDEGGGATMHHQIHHWKVRAAYGLQEWSDHLMGSIPSNPGLFAPIGTLARSIADERQGAADKTRSM